MDQTLTLREANQGFSGLVRRVEGGESFTITRNGRPVARLAPLDGAVRRLSAEQRAALERTKARMARGWPIGAGPLDRDSLHER